MFRLTIRDGLWLVVAVVVPATVFVMSSRRENGRSFVTRGASPQELETIKVRYKAAKGAFDAHASRVSGSGIWPSADEYCGAVERFAQATEASDDLEARVKDLADALKFVQEKASTSLDKFEQGAEQANEVYRYQYSRADMEARLRRAERDLAAAQPTR